ncbi:hypothetical protein, unlikely [Trypanosoma brucei gambiense DAL972]|uniref:Uncharacterized protein n=1 Tax=Trypanosoma brucei gambiense (strain MHOM/CI/86/DAL972) TaxID=679716 RepID=D0A1R0_TRYB9|nr:hypothetical protein, unlikely [Trypanosoma brucei gambiense DAL972]CBH15203.1 hypothetical protein, unlikely [Trypanosoma brucei gambiense DAL972]|eukprot:XP_011777468.1 hypothetical protein, unlikely [Trypanosoma brucei gambiense DAL972]
MLICVYTRLTLWRKYRISQPGPFVTTSPLFRVVPSPFTGVILPAHLPLIFLQPAVAIVVPPLLPALGVSESVTHTFSCGYSQTLVSFVVFYIFCVPSVSA